MATVVHQKSKQPGEESVGAVDKKPVAPFKLDPQVRAYFDARLDAIFATKSEDSNRALHNATKILWELEPRQRALCDVIGRGLGKVF